MLCLPGAHAHAAAPSLDSTALMAEQCRGAVGAVGVAGEAESAKRWKRLQGVDRDGTGQGRARGGGGEERIEGVCRKLSTLFSGTVHPRCWPETDETFTPGKECRTQFRKLMYIEHNWVLML